MIKRDDLTAILNKTLNLPAFAGDVSNNGLQIEGKENVNRILFAVDACQETFDFAAENNCDFIFVHHGISWGGGLKRWTGINARRFSTLFKHGISLYAAHLPLDAHPQYGNNACLADIVGLNNRQPFFEYDGVMIGFAGELSEAATLDQLAEKFGGELEISPLLRGDASRICRKVAIVSGGGGIDSVFAAKEAGCDLLITGEMEHIMHHPANELDLAIIALGHYASETTGVLAMQKFISKNCPAETVFAEIPTGL